MNEKNVILLLVNITLRLKLAVLIRAIDRIELYKKGGLIIDLFKIVHVKMHTHTHLYIHIFIFSSAIKKNLIELKTIR